ncbi:hypothetical protein PMALA_066810 [Plasmodium malariae]|uniref:Uncharacterized protein n=1 Tax=Plasmodium malariae TaxID=5858 RepID=A0A1A8X1C0_PLAMA|nr:hypothetical protein PMALA_066810 [Plasmodium malariae]
MVKSNFCKYLDEKNPTDEKSCERKYRLLANHKKEKCLNIMWKKEDIPHNGEYKKKPIYNTERVSKG